MRHLRFVLLGLLTLTVCVLSVSVMLISYALNSRLSFVPVDVAAGDLLQTPTPTPTGTVPTPVATAVVPGISTVEPREAIVTPEINVAQAQSSAASTDSGSGPPLTTISIASGVGVAAIVLILGAVFRTVRRRPQGD